MITRLLLSLILFCVAIVNANVNKKPSTHHRPHLDEKVDGVSRKRHHHSLNISLPTNIIVTDNNLPISTTSPKFLKDLVKYRLKSNAAEFVSSISEITEALAAEMGGIVEEDTPAQGYVYNPHQVPFNEMVDIAFVFEKNTAAGHKETIVPARVFDNWKNSILGYNIIIMGDKDIVEKIDIPEWMQDRYEVYSKEGIIKTLMDASITDCHYLSYIIRTIREVNNEEASENFSTEDVQSVFDFIDVYSLVAWVSDKEYVYIVDNSFIPPPENMVQGKLTHSVIEKHIANLKTPALTRYYNAQNDPFQPGFDFVHSYPFELRGGVSTVISHGRSIGEPFYDAVTKLVTIQGDAMANHKLNNNDMLRVDTIPSGQLFSMKRDNLAFNRQLLGPAMMFVGGHNHKLKNNFENNAFYNYHDIITGWILKIVIDHCNFGMKYGAPYVYKAEPLSARYHGHSRRLNEAPTAQGNEIIEDTEQDVIVDHVADNDAEILKRRKDRLSLLYDIKSNFTFLADERIYNFFHEWKLNKSSLTYSTSDHCGGRVMKAECIFSELAIEMELHAIGTEYTYFKLLSYYMRLWLNVWHTRNSLLGTTFPLAIKSSYAPSFEKHKPKCAMITITHNERQLLPVWIRYHLRHFHPSDIYILDHITDDNSTHPDKIPKGIHFSKLEGNKYAMPVLFRSNVIRMYQDRLLRAGYKCVLFSDTDEIVIPNPSKFPGGLKQYLDKFASDPKAPLHTRVTGIELGHMSYGNGKPDSQEKPLDWSKSILAQRSFYALDRVYNKPLLSKLPMAYRPGFHRFYNYRIDRSVETDADLVMFHLRSMDFDFCMSREIEKFNMTRTMEQAELNSGFASHWNSYQRDKKTGELCKYAIGCYIGEYQANVTKLFDNTGVFPMYKLEDYWKTVDL